MKNFKKVLSGFVALTMAMSANVISANASGSYLKGDVDGNGSVNLIDAITLVQFLNGSVGADGATAERMDVNRDYVINEYDRAMISSILLGDSSSSTIQSVDTSRLPVKEDRAYYKYDLIENKRTSYTLYTVDDVATSPRTIIDSDDRVQENGLNGVIKAGNGTAFVIDSHTILTAAHVIYDTDQRNILTDIDFVFYDDYNVPLNISITPTAYHIPVLYSSYIENYSWRYDYAIVTVSEDLSSYINFDLGVMRDNMPNTKPIYVTGFGGSGNNVSSSLEGTKSTGVGTLSPESTPEHSSYWNYALYYTTDTVGGDSGGPAYIINTDGTKTVIGINNYGGSSFNQATRITTDIIQFVYNNNYL